MVYKRCLFNKSICISVTSIVEANNCLYSFNKGNGWLQHLPIVTLIQMANASSTNQLPLATGACLSIQLLYWLYPCTHADGTWAYLLKYYQVAHKANIYLTNTVVRQSKLVFGIAGIPVKLAYITDKSFYIMLPMQVILQ
ncbi:MAG: hypothetical protein RL172_1987 [Bacteroidota bacterium]